MLNNLEHYGPNLTEASYSGNFKLIRSANKVVSVFCLSRKGNLLVTASEKEPLFEVILEACRQESILLQGVVGNWSFCSPFWKFLKSKNIIQREVFTEKEVLYAIDLNMHAFPTHSSVRLLEEADYPQWRLLRLDYLAEMGFPHDLTEEQLLTHFVDKTKQKIAWGFFESNKLISIADLNAKSSGLGQVGGVYTLPSFRKKGCSRALMQQLLRDVKELHAIHKVIIFTGENNLAARRLYESLGVSPQGHFALLFGA